MDIVLAALAGLALGVLLTVAWMRQLLTARTASLATERDLLRERVVDLEAAVSEDAQTAALLSPLRDALGRVERQVSTLERDRVEQYGELTARLREVASSTVALRDQTAGLAGALNSSTTRGSWGEVQLQRVLEHSGLLPRCDFDVQVRGTTRGGKSVRPDAVVRLPGKRTLVIDSKAPMTAFLRAQREEVDADERRRLLDEHARQLSGHVDALAAKEYWAAFDAAPEMVVCFVPGDAILVAALAQDPALLESAMARKVVLASPSTLLAICRSVAFAWQQQALTDNALELHRLGQDLYSRLSTVGRHAETMGQQLRRTVDSYNAMVGSLESRVLVTARRMQELDLASGDLPALTVLETGPRSLSAPELLPGDTDDALTEGRRGRSSA